jgi:hypothetical protein
VETLDTTRAIRFGREAGQVVRADVLVGGEVVFSARRTDPDQVLADIEAERRRVAIDQVLLTVLESEGIEAARERHRALLRPRPDSVRFGETLRGNLGYDLIDAGRLGEAIGVFEMNVREYEDSHRAHGALADALRASVGSRPPKKVIAGPFRPRRRTTPPNSAGTGRYWRRSGAR